MVMDIVLGFVGGGNMAKAIAQGLLKKGLISPEKIIVSCPSDKTRESWNLMSVKTTSWNTEVVEKADVIILAFKPYQLQAAFCSLSSVNSSTKSKLFISILAGITCTTLYQELEKVLKSPRLIRVMPNTPAMVLEGCTVVSYHHSCNTTDQEIAKTIFSSLGTCEVVPESTLTAVTGLTGSGPAYIYVIIEALSDGAVKQGLPRDLATKFAAQTVLGAAKMVLETKKHPSQLKDDVCSAGGTTIHGIHALEKGGLRASLMNAVEAAAQRGIEIGKKPS